jgi:fructokinase
MRKVIGIGETIMDIIFKNGKPTAAVPGGSVFNGIISLGRLGINVSLISETGNDRVGDQIIEFLEDNGVEHSGVIQYHNGRSAISLAWLKFIVGIIGSGIKTKSTL